MPNPRKEFVEFLGKHDPVAIEKLVIDINACSDSAFAEVCALVAKLAKTQNVKDAVLAADAEVEKKPKKEAQADAKLA